MLAISHGPRRVRVVVSPYTCSTSSVVVKSTSLSAFTSRESLLLLVHSDGGRGFGEGKREMRGDRDGEMGGRKDGAVGVEG